MDLLKDSRERLTDENDKLDVSVNKLKGDADQYEKDVESVSVHIGEMEKLLTDGQDMIDVIRDTNDVFDSIRSIISRCEQAHLWSAYLKCAFKDDDDRMSEEEFKNFLGRLTQQRRNHFAKLGSFQVLAGDDDQIELAEFEVIMEKVSRDIDDVLREEFAKMV